MASNPFIYGSPKWHQWNEEHKKKKKNNDNGSSSSSGRNNSYDTSPKGFYERNKNKTTTGTSGGYSGYRGSDTSGNNYSSSRRTSSYQNNQPYNQQSNSNAGRYTYNGTEYKTFNQMMMAKADDERARRKKAEEERKSKEIKNSKSVEDYIDTSKNKFDTGKQLNKKVKSFAERQQETRKNTLADIEEKRTAPTNQEMLRKADAEREKKNAKYLKEKEETLSKATDKDITAARIAQKNGTATDKQKDLLEKTSIGANGRVLRDLRKADEEVRDVDIKKVGQAAEAGAEQAVGGFLKAVGYDTNPYKERKKILDHNLQLGKISQESYDKQLKELDKTGYAKAYKNTDNSISHKFFKSIFEKGKEINDEGNLKYQEASKDSKGFEKALLGAVNSGVGMAGDIGLNALTGNEFAWIPSMLTRTFGNNLGETNEQYKDTTQLQDERYASLQALKEVGTELMFSGAGVAKKMVGGKALISGADRLADFATKNIGSSMGKNVASTGIKAIGGTIEENAEEVAGWLLDPTIANIAYANEIDNKNKNSVTDNIDAQRNNLRKSIAGLDENSLNAVISRINSDSFINDLAQSYINEGASENIANQFALKMRDILASDLAGDDKKSAELEKNLVNEIAGKQSVKEKLNFDDLLDTLASTTVLTLGTGLPGAVIENNQLSKVGKAQKDALGNSGIRSLTEKAIDFDDAAMSIRAQSMRDSIDNGKELSDTQVGELSRAMLKQENIDNQRQQSALMSAEKVIQEDKSLMPVYRDNQGNTMLGERTAEIQAENKKNIEKVIQDSKALKSMPEEKSNAISNAISNWQTGIMTVGDSNELTYTNTEARELFEKTTGQTLPIELDRNGNVDITKTNIATKDFLFQTSATNLTETAKEETAYFKNTYKPKVDADVMSRLGSEGQSAYLDITNKLDITNPTMYVKDSSVIAEYYSAGRNSSFTSFEEFQNKIDNPVFKSVDIEARKEAFEAGLNDKALARNPIVGATIEQGAEIKGTKSNYKGKGILYNESQTATQEDVDVFNSISKTLGVDIHLVDSLTDNGTKNGNQVNGKYDNGEIWLNINDKTDRNIGYIFMHEITHWIKANAPSEFNELEQMVRNAWFEQDSVGMQNAISNKIEQYKKVNPNFTEAQAMEEIIADATYEMIQDEEFAKEIARDNPSLARAILDGIRAALRKLRSIFASTRDYSPRYNANLLSSLNVLKEAERLWLNAAHEAAKNRADGFIAENNGETKYLFAGYAEDGRGIYISDYKKGTPKSEKTSDILDLIQNVWSKKPISLEVVNENGVSKKIEAQFDPYYEEGELSDAGKIAGGNRNGNAAERRVNLNIGKDYYKILNEAEYAGSAKEDGNHDYSKLHNGVRQWHYFINQIYYMEDKNSNKEPYSVIIHVKEKDDGSFVYSFESVNEKRTSANQLLYWRGVNPPNADSSLSKNNLPQQGNAVKKFSLTDGGYDGHSMSNRARRAYENGEKPISKWNKSEILSGIEEYAEDNYIKYNVEGLNKLTSEELRNNFLSYASWHHTGAMYNATTFYKLNVPNNIDETVSNIIANRKKVNKSEEELAKERKNREALNNAKDIYSKMQVIFESNILGLKTMQGIISRWNKGNIDLENIYDEALQKIKDRDVNKVNGWRKLPENHYRQEYVSLYDNNLEEYVNRVYGKEISSNSKDIQSIKNNLLKETNTQYSLTEEQQRLDKEYMQSIESGDMEKAQQMVDDAAKKAGYDSPMLYHGTKSFGFTTYDLLKSDDNKTIFATSDKDVASTYSGKDIIRDVNDKNNTPIESMNIEDVANELTKLEKGNIYDKYYVQTPEDVRNIKSNIDTNIQWLKNELPDVIKQYDSLDVDKLDENEKSTKEHEYKLLTDLDNKLNNSKKTLDISTPIFIGLNHFNIDFFNKNKDRLRELEHNVRLLDEGEKNFIDGSEQWVVVEMLDGYSIETISEEDARKHLEEVRNVGIYKLYAKYKQPYIYDAKGLHWNEISINKIIDILPKDMQFLAQYATANINLRTLAFYAKYAGYDSVIIKNVIDNGGQNLEMGDVKPADVYIVFNPSNIKSADPITYDDNNNIIPLSQRFNPENEDIRYSLPSLEEMDEHRNILAKDMEESYGSSFTSNPKQSGYIYPNGKMLNMGKGSRGEDHRLVQRLYDTDNINTSGFTSMANFMNEGNIRWIPETESFDFGVAIEPTEEQYNTIRNLANKYDIEMIEFTDENGTVDEKDYGDGAKPEELINDIKRFYKNGSIGGSQLSQFRYSLVENDAEPYSDKTMYNWKNSKNIVVYKNPKQYEKFVRDALNGKNAGKKMYFGTIPKNVSEMVLEKTGINISKKNIALGADEIRKIIKKHGTENEYLSGQKPIVPNDFSNIISVITNPTDIELDGTYNDRPVIKFIKKSRNKTTVVTYDSKKSNDIRIQTMYINIKKESLATPTGEQAPINTPEANSGTASLISNSLQQDKEDVKYSLTDPTSEEIEQARERIKSNEIEIKTLQNYIDTLNERRGMDGVSDEEIEQIDKDIFETERMITKYETLNNTMRENIAIAEQNLPSEQIDAENFDFLDEIGNYSAMPTEDEVLDNLAEDVANNPDDYDIKDLPQEDRLLEESRQRRSNIRDEVKAYAEEKKKHKQTVLTKDKILNEKSVKAACLDLTKFLMLHSEYVAKSGNNAQYSTKVLNFVIDSERRIFKLYKDGDYDGMWNAAFDSAAELIENITIVDDALFEEYKAVRDYFRSTPIYVPETVKNNMPKGFAGLFRANFGRMRLTNNMKDTSIEDAYEEMKGFFGDIFTPDLEDPTDMLMDFSNTLDKLQDYTIAYESEEAFEIIKSTATDMIDIAMDNGEAWQTFADRKKKQYDEQTRRLKQRHKEAIQDIKNKEKKKVEKIKQHYKEKEIKRKTLRDKAKSFKHIQENYDWLSSRLLKPSDDKHIPEGFKSSIANLLQQMDLQTERSKKLEEKYGKAKKTIKMNEIRRQLSELAKEDDSGIFEYDGYVFELIDALDKKLDGQPIDSMDYEDIKSVDILLAYIRNGISNYNKAFSDSIKENIDELALESIEHNNDVIKKRGKAKESKGVKGFVSGIINESMVTPIDMFERLGGGLYKGYKALRIGFDTHEKNIKYLRESVFTPIFSKYSNKKKPGSALEKWRDDSTAKEFTLENGEKIKMSVAQIMSLHCLNKREQAVGHILGSGIVLTDISSHAKFREMLGKGREIDTTSKKLTPADVVNIISTLTDEQKYVADKMQDVLNTVCADWGNETSMKMYGYKKFTEQNYFPIISSNNYLDSNFDVRETAERIRNFGFTKGTVVNANNPIVIDDFFTVISDHMNKMSLYNAFAAPIADFQKIYNFKQRNEEGVLVGSVKSSVETTYGKKTSNYISNFMTDLNGSTQIRPDGTKAALNKALGNYKKAAVGANLRVGLQQPTAVIRAMDIISPKYFYGGINIKKNMQEMYEHCPIAEWKAWGNYQVDMTRDLEDIMMNSNWGIFDTITMGAYGALDNITWSVIWNAVKHEVKAKNKGIDTSSTEFWNKCNERASYVFDKTQVVDSVFHRSQGMRSQDIAMKTITSFKAEPTRTFNMVRSDFLDARALWQDGKKLKAIGKMNRTTLVFVANAAFVSAAAAIADAIRGKGDDDKDKSMSKIELWWENFINNFKDNGNLIKNIYFIGDAWGLLDGFGTSNMALEGWEALMDNINDWEEYMQGGSKKTTGDLLKDMAGAIGYIAGIPTKNAIRDIGAVFDAMGIDLSAFAAETGEDESIIDKAKSAFGFTGNDTKVKEKDSASNNEKERFRIFDKLGVTDGSKFDNFLNKLGINLSDEEIAEREFNEKLNTALDKAKGLTGEERNKKIWSVVSDDYTKSIAEGDFARIEEIRNLVKAAKGDTMYADEQIKKKLSTEYKKTIGDDKKSTLQTELRDYMQDKLGVNDMEISNLCYSSESAKKLKAACRILDHDMAVDAIQDLIAAGITKQDVYRVWDNRNSGDVSKYLSLDSTGSYVCPTQGTITSPFGYRSAPTAGASTYHEGIDIGAASGSNVGATDGGRVTYAGYNGGYGNQVQITHADGTVTYYSHLSQINVRPGDTVAQSQVIGLVGSTGTSTGPHLDFRVKYKNRYIDPMIFLNGGR